MRMNFSSLVNAPCSQVFEAFSDFKNAADRVEGIEKIELIDGDSIGVGTRFRETRIMFGRPSTEEMEVTEFIPGQRYTVEANTCGSHFQTIFNFKPDGDATVVDVELNTRALTLFAKIMTPIGFLMAGPMKKMFASDIEQLKKYCESDLS